MEGKEVAKQLRACADQIEQSPELAFLSIYTLKAYLEELWTQIDSGVKEEVKKQVKEDMGEAT